MNNSFKSRNFYPDELRILKALKSKSEKAGYSKIKFYHFIFAGLLGSGLAFITSIIPDSFWTFLFGTIAVFSFSFIVFAPFEIYKMKKIHKEFLKQLNMFIDRGKVSTLHIKANRIALAHEYEDESDMYIIELNEYEVMYLWDLDYNISKKFPCLEFEIYEENFVKLIGRQVYPLSNKIKPIIIDKAAKWNFMKQFGVLGNLETETISFDKLLEQYKNCV